MKIKQISVQVNKVTPHSTETCLCFQAFYFTFKNHSKIGKCRGVLKQQQIRLMM